MRISDWSSDVCSSDLLLIFEIVAQADHHPGDGFAVDGDAVFVDGEDMREQVAAEQLGQRGGERRLRRDKRSGMGHFPPPFGLSLSKPRSFLPASKKDSPSTSSGDRKSTRLNSSH